MKWIRWKLPLLSIGQEKLMKIQNGRQMASFSPIWPILELDLYLNVMNAYTKYEMNAMNIGPVIDRTRKNSKWPPGGHFKSSLTYIRTWPFFWPNKHMYQIWNESDENSPSYRLDKKNFWKFKMAAKRPFLFQFDLYPNLTFILILWIHIPNIKWMRWKLHLLSIGQVKIQNGRQAAILNPVWPIFELDLYFDLINTCTKYEKNPMKTPLVIDRTRKIYENSKWPPNGHYYSNLTYIRTWPLFWPKEQMYHIWNDFDENSICYWADKIPSTTDGRTDGRTDGQVESSIPHHQLRWRGV